MTRNAVSPCRDHQDAATGREHMADDIGDRVRLAGSWRSLNHEPLGLLEAPNDLDLVVVEGLWEEQVALIRIDWLFDRQAPCVACFDRVTDWLEGVIDLVAGPHDKRARSAFEHDRIDLVGSKLSLETFDIAENRIRGSPAREENVPVRHREIAASGSWDRLRRRRRQNLRQVPTVRIEATAAGLENGFVGLGTKGRDALAVRRLDRAQGAIGGIFCRCKALNGELLERTPVDLSADRSRPDRNGCTFLVSDLDFDLALEERQIYGLFQSGPTRQSESPDELG